MPTPSIALRRAEWLLATAAGWTAGAGGAPGQAARQPRPAVGAGQGQGGGSPNPPVQPLRLLGAKRLAKLVAAGPPGIMTAAAAGPLNGRGRVLAGTPAPCAPARPNKQRAQEYGGGWGSGVRARRAWASPHPLGVFGAAGWRGKKAGRAHGAGPRASARRARTAGHSSAHPRLRRGTEPGLETRGARQARGCCCFPANACRSPACQQLLCGSLNRVSAIVRCVWGERGVGGKHRKASHGRRLGSWHDAQRSQHRPRRLDKRQAGESMERGWHAGRKLRQAAWPC
jgi:hypothetical protein